MVQELWSCGQTGVAYGALLAAAHCGLRTGGWMALGFANENGPDPALAAQFHLEEFTRAGELQPIRRNVKESDATLWIAPPPRIEIDPAYWVTRKAVATYGHPFLAVASKVKAPDAGAQIAVWAQRWNVTRLHVMGPRESLWAGGEARARLVVSEALHALGTCQPRPGLALVG